MAICAIMARRAGGLAAGALQLVVENGVLEGDQVEPGGVLHQLAG